jgi:hypothetical protein
MLKHRIPLFVALVLVFVLVLAADAVAETPTKEELAAAIRALDSHSAYSLVDRYMGWHCAELSAVAVQMMMHDQDRASRLKATIVWQEIVKQQDHTVANNVRLGLENEDPLIQRDAVQILENSGGSSWSIAFVDRLLKYDEQNPLLGRGEVIMRTERFLKTVPDESLRRVVNHEDPKIRRFAATAIAARSNSVLENMRPLFPHLSHADPARRVEAIRAHYPLPVTLESDAKIETMIDDPDPEVRKFAMGFLGYRSTLDSDRVIAATQHPDPAVRRIAAGWMGNHRKRPEQAVQALAIVVADDQDAETVLAAINSLKALGERAGPAVPALCGRLHEGQEYATRMAIVQCCATIGPDAAPAVDHLRAMKGKTPADQLKIEYALWRITAETESLLSCLSLEFDEVELSQSFSIPHETAMIVKELGPAAQSLSPRVIRHLKRQLASPTAPHWNAYTATTIRVLASIGPDARDALPLLEQVLTMDVKGTSSKEEAAKAIVIIRDDASVEK